MTEPKAPSEMKRYDCEVLDHSGGMQENVEGTYVLHSDHEAAMKEAIEMARSIERMIPEGRETIVPTIVANRAVKIARAFLQSKGVKT